MGGRSAYEYGEFAKPGKDCWIDWYDPSDEEKKIWTILGKSVLDQSQFRANGIPAHWKYAWCWPLTLLRFLLVFWTWLMGSNLLMETGGIVDSILNSLALTFIFDLDEAMFKAFGN